MHGNLWSMTTYTHVQQTTKTKLRTNQQIEKNYVNSRTEFSTLTFLSLSEWLRREIPMLSPLSTPQYWPTSISDHIFHLDEGHLSQFTSNPNKKNQFSEGLWHF